MKGKLLGFHRMVPNGCSLSRLPISRSLSLWCSVTVTAITIINYLNVNDENVRGGNLAGCIYNEI